jgi:hypothetical protein
MNTIVLPTFEPHAIKFVNKNGNTLCLLHIRHDENGTVVHITLHGTAPVHLQVPGLVINQLNIVNEELIHNDAHVIVVTDQPR